MNEYFVKRTCCPVCESIKKKLLIREPYTKDPIRNYLHSFYNPQGGVEFKYLEKQEYILVECLDCGLIYQEEIPNNFIMHKLYEEWINPKKVFELNENHRGIEYFSNLSSEIIRIIRLLDIPPKKIQLLDFSMGWGHWCRIAQAFGCNVHGTEFSNDRINYAKKSGIQVIDYHDIMNFRYDFINTNQVFEHIPEPRKVIAHLKNSGYVHNKSEQLRHRIRIKKFQNLTRKY